ncbi:metallophosphoesterase [Enterococcus diestrammenae]|uniref:Metallophosphatase n=1 Tax=Enterococcus diestrammenae TaxID=1155073 RepID=A0ABV0F250_9ENTE|nr:metallophosphoesterase [Enterococcus diestrammenae]KAF1294899.1 metallophosphatase [Enterococcus diestrammenae]HIX70025.1 metallophosphoesterase family protein [Candidatus Enterococcus stercoravium]
MKFFTSDTHFFHEDLLGSHDFAPRPFKTVMEMNETIVTHWNQVVKVTDIVYHLGDIAMHPDYEQGFPAILDLLTRLNGEIHFVKGNHDNRAFLKYLAAHDPGGVKAGRPKFFFHDVGVLLKFDHHQYYLTHYPMLLGITKNIRNLHGHIHHASVPIKEDLNVGVDAPELAYLPEPQPFGAPISENQIGIIAKAKAEELAKLRM